MPAHHVYLHVPFCARRCVYCDFAIAVRREVPAERFAALVDREVRQRGLGGGEVATLYLGGGTPSRLGADGVARVLEVLTRHWPTTPDAEVTLEANPEDVTAEAARRWRAAGVNRVSLGVQSFDPAVLQWMRRGHDAEGVRRAVEALRDAGITDLSLDLIYGVPSVLGREWRRDLDEALRLEPQHLSCYGLTVEPRTPLGRIVARGEVTAAPEESHEDEFFEAHSCLTAAGFGHYEVSNYALPGAVARHNSAYWNRVPYDGVGPSAHGFDGMERRWNVAAWEAWATRVEDGGDPVEGRERLGEPERLLEELYFDLRTRRGTLIHANDRPMLDRWIAEGWGEEIEGRLRLTPAGWMRLDALVSALTDHRSRCNI